MNIIEQIKAALAAATQERIGVVMGDRACFHPGNRVSVVAVYDSNPEEVLTPTVAEFWPTSDDTDIADATLYVLMKNTLPALIECVEALEELHDIVQGHLDDKLDKLDSFTVQPARAALAKLENAK